MKTNRRNRERCVINSLLIISGKTKASHVAKGKNVRSIGRWQDLSKYATARLSEFGDTMKMLVQKDVVPIAIDLHRPETWLATTAKGTLVVHVIDMFRICSKMAISVSSGRVSIVVFGTTGCSAESDCFAYSM